MGAGRNACLSSSQIKLKRMKVLNGILSSVLSILSLYLFLQAKTTLDLSFAFIVMMGAIVFILFLVIEEQRDDIEQLRRQVWEKDNMYTIKGGDGRTYVGYK
jgi:hypothetical protein